MKTFIFISKLGLWGELGQHNTLWWYKTSLLKELSLATHMTAREGKRKKEGRAGLLQSTYLRGTERREGKIMAQKCTQCQESRSPCPAWAVICALTVTLLMRNSVALPTLGSHWSKLAIPLCGGSGSKSDVTCDVTDTWCEELQDDVHTATHVFAYCCRVLS